MRNFFLYFIYINFLGVYSIDVEFCSLVYFIKIYQVW